MFAYLASALERCAEKFGERKLNTKNNPISQGKRCEGIGTFSTRFKNNDMTSSLP